MVNIYYFSLNEITHSMNMLKQLFKPKYLTPLGRWGIPADKRLSAQNVYDHSLCTKIPEKYCEFNIRDNIVYCKKCFSIIPKHSLDITTHNVGYVPKSKCKRG